MTATTLQELLMTVSARDALRRSDGRFREQYPGTPLLEPGFVEEPRQDGSVSVTGRLGDSRTAAGRVQQMVDDFTTEGAWVAVLVSGRQMTVCPCRSADDANLIVVANGFGERSGEFCPDFVCWFDWDDPERGHARVYQPLPQASWS